MRTIPPLPLLAALAALVGCGVFGDDTASAAPATEGTNPGECADRADNDGDGAFDCNDDNCAGAPDCEPADDTGRDTSAGQDTDEDTGTPANRAPSAPTVTILPADPEPGGTLLCSLTDASSDPDGDPLAYSVAWTRDGDPIEGAETSAYDDDTMPGENTLDVEERVWSCEMTVSDGQLTAASSALAIVPGTCDIPDVLRCGDELASLSGRSSEMVTDLGDQSTCSDAMSVPGDESSTLTLTPRVEVCPEGGDRYSVSAVLRIESAGHGADMGIRAAWPDGTQATLRRWYYDSMDGNGAHAQLVTSSGEQLWLGDGASMGYDGWLYGWARGMSAEGGWVLLELAVVRSTGAVTFTMFDPDTSSSPYTGTLSTTLSDELPTFTVYTEPGYYGAPAQVAELDVSADLWSVE